MSLYEDALGIDDVESLNTLDFDVYSDHTLYSKKKWRAKCIVLNNELIVVKKELEEFKKNLK
jgi:hypothetical protein